MAFLPKREKKSWEKNIKPKSWAKKQYTTDALAKEYNNVKWRKLRAIYAKRNPLCISCLGIGRYTPMNVVDHIKPISDGGEMYNWDNLQSLCTSCHQSKTANDMWAKKRLEQS